MNKYLVLYRSEDAFTGISSPEKMEASPLDQMATEVSAWQVWYESCRDSVIDLGAPLGKSTTLPDGSEAPGEKSIMGFSLIQADSVQAATELMKNHPHFHMPGASVEILEYMPIPSM